MTQEENKVELAFVQQLAAKGYASYVEAAHVEDVSNRDEKYPAYGFVSPMGNKPVAVSLPKDEWLLLADAIKKKYGK